MLTVQWTRTALSLLNQIERGIMWCIFLSLETGPCQSSSLLVGNVKLLKQPLDPWSYKKACYLSCKVYNVNTFLYFDFWFDFLSVACLSFAKRMTSSAVSLSLIWASFCRSSPVYSPSPSSLLLTQKHHHFYRYNCHHDHHRHHRHQDLERRGIRRTDKRLTVFTRRLYQFMQEVKNVFFLTTSMMVWWLKPVAHCVFVACLVSWIITKAPLAIGSGVPAGSRDTKMSLEYFDHLPSCETKWYG